jgi:flagellar motor switch protein FliM
MPNEFLSQDEVDALLTNVEAQGVDAPQPMAHPLEAHNFDLTTQKRITRDRLPTLDIIHERFAKLLRIGMFNFVGRNADISCTHLRFVKYGDFLKDMQVPCNINIVKMKPLRGNAIVAFEPNLVYLMIDNLFGGDGRFHTVAESHEATATEQRIVMRMLDVVCSTYQNAWQPAFPLEFTYVRSEIEPGYANIANASEMVMVQTIEIKVGEHGGLFQICIPCASIDPIRDLLSTVQHGDQIEPDQRWLQQLAKQVQSAEVELVAVLAETSVTLKQILNMKIGDVIVLDIKPSVTAAVDNVPVFRCRHGISKGQYALRIEEVISPSRRNDSQE